MSATISTRDWGVAALLLVLTFASTMYAGAQMVTGPEASAASGSPVFWLQAWSAGWVFALPLMAILLAHEFGHFIAGRLHGVNISPPFFLPMPIFLFGTLGAVIQLRAPIRNRNALLDVGAAGPIAGMLVALPVLAWGLHQSPVEPLPSGPYLLEGRSLLYSALLYLTKGSIPAGYDVQLTPMALAGWVGLLVTMINLLPVGQLDGGHIAYALLGPKQNRMSESLRRALPLVAVLVGLAYGWPAWSSGARGEALANEVLAGAPWLVWSLVLWLMTRMSGREHPPTDPGTLSPKRRAVGRFTMALFILLFMPTWLRATEAPDVTLPTAHKPSVTITLSKPLPSLPSNSTSCSKEPQAPHMQSTRTHARI